MVWCVSLGPTLDFIFLCLLKLIICDQVWTGFCDQQVLHEDESILNDSEHALYREFERLPHGQFYDWLTVSHDIAVCESGEEDDVGSSIKLL